MNLHVSPKFRKLSKRLAAAAIIVTAFAFPVAAAAATTVKIEADTTVANATTSGSWATSASATYNQVVAVQVVYNNDETAGSGKTANNLHVKVNIPTTAGANQTITTTTSSDNSNTVTGTAKVSLGRSDAYLQYIPGTATWKHAVSANSSTTTTQKVSDSVVTAANGLVLENENPCQAGSVVVQARVMVPGVKVTKQVRVLNGGNTWATSMTATPGQTVEYMITYENTGNTQQNNVVVRDNLPANTTLVAGTTYLANQTNPNGILAQNDSVAQGGLLIGNYAPTANAFVKFAVKMPTEDKLNCGTNTLTNVGIAQPEGMQQYYNTAVVTITKTCTTTPSTPVYTCDAFDVTTAADRKVSVSKFNYTANNGATFNNVVVDWGDQTNTASNSPVGQTHQYAKDGTYTLTATAHFTVNGKDVTDSKNCAKTVTITTPATPTTTTPTTTTTLPKTLVNTGAGSSVGLVGLFAAVAAAGTFAHRKFMSRRLAR